MFFDSNTWQKLNKCFIDNGNDTVTVRCKTGTLSGTNQTVNSPMGSINKNFNQAITESNDSDICELRIM